MLSYNSHPLTREGNRCLLFSCIIPEVPLGVEERLMVVFGIRSELALIDIDIVEFVVGKVLKIYFSRSNGKCIVNRCRCTCIRKCVDLGYLRRI